MFPINDGHHSILYHIYACNITFIIIRPIRRRTQRACEERIHNHTYANTIFLYFENSKPTKIQNLYEQC